MESLNILMMEYDSSVSFTTKDALEHLGHRVIVYHEQEQIFLEKIKDKPIDLVLMDLNTNGSIEAVKHMNKYVNLTQEEQRAIAILFQSAGTTVSIRDMSRYIWKNNIIQYTSLRNLIATLRDKLPELHLMYSPISGYCIE